VLPLQNISIAATDSCFFRNITLSVDTIPNATYTWYRKITPNDSTLIGNELSYNLPFFLPEEIGQYVCKVSINDGCVTRLSYFTLDGDCNNTVLASSLQLQAKKAGRSNQLKWHNNEETGVIKYVVERKRGGESSFIAIGVVNVSGGNYWFNDNNPGSGVSRYRVRVVYANSLAYTNVVSLKSGDNTIMVYPNPVKNSVNISFSADTPSDYQIQLLNASGHLVYSKNIRNITTSVVSYNRTPVMHAGVYILRITNTRTGITDIHKVLFE